MNYTEPILQLCSAYPALQPADIFKFLYQSIFGCEHLVTEEAAALARIADEAAGYTPQCAAPLVQPLAGGSYCRVDLAVLQKGLSARTLYRLFLLSARTDTQTGETGAARLSEALQQLTDLATRTPCPLPFGAAKLRAAVKAWQAKGCPALHHSTEYRDAYRPAYRVIRAEYAKLLQLLRTIDTHLAEKPADGRPLTVALEGRCASGKTTLATLLGEIYDCSLFHMDDFFLTPALRTPERLAVPGENVDHERFLSQVLQPLTNGQTVQYIRYDCHTGKLLPPVTPPKKGLAIIEGSYCLHPALRPYYDLKVFLSLSPETQRSRILHRNAPAEAEAFFTRWIPLEECYFTACHPEQAADILLPE